MSCQFCDAQNAEFDCNGLKFCDEKCGIKYMFAEAEIECVIVDVEIITSTHKHVPHGSRGFVINPVNDGLNLVVLEHQADVYCHMYELRVIDDGLSIYLHKADSINA